MTAGKDRVLIVGATGNIGNLLAKASLALGHPTFLLFRPDNVSDLRKCHTYMELKMQGAQLLQGSLDDHESLVSALKQVDVVLSPIAGYQTLEQLKLVEAIKHVGTIKRYIPSEFGMDPNHMVDALPETNVLYDPKRAVRRAIEEANIPHTYVSVGCFNGSFLAGLGAPRTFMPPRDHVKILGSGDKRTAFILEEDTAVYTMLAVSDPRTLNKTLYLRPPANILSQMEVVNIWEKLIGKELKKTFISAEEFLAPLHDEGLSPFYRGKIALYYHIFYRGGADFEVEGPDAISCSDLYPNYNCVTVEEYMKRFV